MNIRSCLVLGCVLTATTQVCSAQTQTQAKTQAPTTGPTSPAANRVNKTSPYHGMKLSEKARAYYPAAWGVDHLRTSYTSSGNLIRFSYRVVEP